MSKKTVSRGTMKKAKRKPGRPAFRLDEKELRQLKSLAQCGCTNNEIAAVLEYPFSTIYHNYGEVIREGRNSRNAALRHAQFKLAVDKLNPRMLEWLGIQYLGQQGRNRMEMPALDKLVAEYEKLTDDERKARIARLLDATPEDTSGRAADRGKAGTGKSVH